METPIYRELQQELIDPEASWSPSAPPEFAAALAERAEQSQSEGKRAKTDGKKSSQKGPRGRAGGRRHRADD